MFAGARPANPRLRYHGLTAALAAWPKVLLPATAGGHAGKTRFTRCSFCWHNAAAHCAAQTASPLRQHSPSREKRLHNAPLSSLCAQYRAFSVCLRPWLHRPGRAASPPPDTTCRAIREYRRPQCLRTLLPPAPLRAGARKDRAGPERRAYATAALPAPPGPLPAWRK